MSPIYFIACQAIFSQIIQSSHAVIVSLMSSIAYRNMQYNKYIWLFIWYHTKIPTLIFIDLNVNQPPSWDLAISDYLSDIPQWHYMPSKHRFDRHIILREHWTNQSSYTNDNQYYLYHRNAIVIIVYW